MRKIYALLTMLASFSLTLSACSFVAPVPTPTANPTNTPFPTSTSTPIPTDTPVPANTLASEATLALGDTKTIKEGGYSFHPPLGYELNIKGTQVGVSDTAGTLIISISGATSNPQNLSSEKIADDFISAVFKKGKGEYTKGASYPVEVDGVAGLAYDITGTLFGSPLRGQAIVVMPNNNQYLFGLGVANTEKNKNQWEDEGIKVFDALIHSITFLTSEEASSSDSCAISTDETYGYTQENPIKVGGDGFDGPPRERAYLDNLAGPKGEKISYNRAGSMGFGDTILDAFVITGLSKEITIYIDEYSFTEPQAPVGFTCLGPFSLQKP